MDFQDYGNYGRISHGAFMGVTITLFAMAMMTAISRFIIQWHNHKRFYADDYVLLFGCIVLVAAFVMTMVSLPYIYFGTFLLLGPAPEILKYVAAPGFLERIHRFVQMAFATEVLDWVAVFAVKFAYLLFFRQMVDRLKGILTYWKVTMGVVVVSCIYCIIAIFIACPDLGAKNPAQCLQGPAFTKSFILSWVANSLDMLTDILIVVVPIVLLRRVKIRLHQKIILGSLLCLSLCMFVITVIRATKFVINSNVGKAIDLQWVPFWHFVEACVAVIVVSMTAFRSLYSVKLSKNSGKQRQPWSYSYKKYLNGRNRRRRYDEFGDPISVDSDKLPQIPGATMTGMISMINQKSWMGSQSRETSMDEYPQQPRDHLP